MVVTGSVLIIERQMQLPLRTHIPYLDLQMLLTASPVLAGSAPWTYVEDIGRSSLKHKTRRKQLSTLAYGPNQCSTNISETNGAGAPQPALERVFDLSG